MHAKEPLKDSGVGPTFLIIGAAKSGTTSLWNYLRQHPEIHLSPRKHTRFFTYRGSEPPSFSGPPPKNESVPYAVSDLQSYLDLFAGAPSRSARGEASHSYLYSDTAASRIHEYSQAMKIIAVLRHPADRAFSHYRQMIRDGREPLENFFEALEAEQYRVERNWWPSFHYTSVGMYGEQLERYYALFDESAIKVILYEDFVSDSASVLQDIHRFLGVGPLAPGVPLPRFNASGLPKNRLLHRILIKSRKAKPAASKFLNDRAYRKLLLLGGYLHNRNLTTHELLEDDRRYVTDRYFRDDLMKLETLIGRDLTSWIGLSRSRGRV